MVGVRGVLEEGWRFGWLGTDGCLGVPYICVRTIHVCAYAHARGRGVGAVREPSLWVVGVLGRTTTGVLLCGFQRIDRTGSGRMAVLGCG